VGEARGELKGLEFYQDQNAVYLVKESALARVLAEQGLSRGFVDYVRNNTAPSLDGYLAGLPASQAGHLKRYSLRSIPKAGPARLTSLRPNLVDPVSGTPYIPGSSLKGALRGAFLLAAARREGEKTERLKEAVLQKKNRRAGEQFEGLLRTTFRNTSGPQTDWLRFLHLSDAFPKVPACTAVYEVRVVSLNEEGGYHWGGRGAVLRVEAFRPGTTLSAALRVDDRGLALLQRASRSAPGLHLEEVVALATAKFREVLAEEQEFFYLAGLEAVAEELEALEQEGANLRLGWGAGLLSTSLALLLSQKERQQLRQNYFPPRRYPVFPQSRKALVKDNLPVLTLGWLKMSLEEVRPR
jgi:CRISPR-associated protein Csm5